MNRDIYSVTSTRYQVLSTEYRVFTSNDSSEVNAYLNLHRLSQTYSPTHLLTYSHIHLPATDRPWFPWSTDQYAPCRPI
jgi:hypothetical protein